MRKVELRMNEQLKYKTIKDLVDHTRVLQLMHFQTDILPLCDKGFILSSFCYFCVVQLCTLWYNNVVRL